MNKKTETIRDMTTGNIPRMMITFALPFMLANLLQALYSVVDMAVVGQFLGSVGLSATSVGGQITNFLTLTGVAIGNAGQILVGQMVGAKDRDGMAGAISSLMRLVLIIGIAFTVAGLLVYPYALQWLNTPAEAMADAKDYLRVCCYGIFFIFAYNAICGVLRGIGDSKRPLIFVAVSAVVNLVLDILFVAVFHWGVWGAAVATVIGQGVSFVAALVYLLRKKEELGVPKLLSGGRIEGMMKLLLTLGAPLALMQVCIHITMLIVTAYVNEYGLVATAVNGVGNKLYSVISVVSGAMVSATATMVAQNMGAKKPERAEKAVWTGLAIDTVVAVLISVVAWFWPEQVFGLFNKEPEVLTMAREYMHISILLYVSFNLMTPLLGLYNGVGAVKQSFLVSVLDSVVARLGLSFLFAWGCHMGVNGFFLGTALAGWVSVFIPGAYFLSGKWKNKKLLAEK